MSKRVLIGLLTASVVAMWGTEANAFNRVLGVLVKHTNPWIAEVSLSGFEPNSLLTLIGRATVEILCQKPGNQSFKRKVDLDITEQLMNFPLIFPSVKTVVLDLSSAKCPNGFPKVVGSEVIVKLDLRITWEKCTGSTVLDGNPCFEDSVKTTEPIETLKTSNCVPGVRDPEGGGVPPQTLTCDVVQVGPDGPPPPPPPEFCGDGVANGEEQCDGADLNGQSCDSLDLPASILGCNSSCTFDTSGCFGGS